MKYPIEVREAMALLSANGDEAYIVGGCLRNMLMGKQPHDWDMTTSALPCQTAEVFRSKGYSVIETGIKHGTVTVLINRLPIEITTFRVDGEYSDSRHPDNVSFTPSLEEDLARRDFTVNAMAYSEKSGLVDLYNGKKDLSDMLLRAVGDASKRFKEDALRILRAFRFSAEHGFSIEENTKKAIIEGKEGLINISRERIYAELYRALLGDYAEKAISALIECGLLPFIFAEYKDEATPVADIIGKLPKNIGTRLAALIWPLGREKAESALASLKMSNQDKKAVKNTLEAAVFLKSTPVRTEEEARLFIAHFPLNFSDSTMLASLLGDCSKASQMLIEKAAKSDFPKSVGELAIGGAEIISLGANGRETGEVLSFLLERAILDPKQNNKNNLKKLALKYISERKK